MDSLNRYWTFCQPNLRRLGGQEDHWAKNITKIFSVNLVYKNNQNRTRSKIVTSRQTFIEQTNKQMRAPKCYLSVLKLKASCVNRRSHWQNFKTFCAEQLEEHLKFLFGYNDQLLFITTIGFNNILLLISITTVILCSLMFEWMNGWVN